MHVHTHAHFKHKLLEVTNTKKKKPTTQQGKVARSKVFADSNFGIEIAGKQKGTKSGVWRPSCWGRHVSPGPGCPLLREGGGLQEALQSHPGAIWGPTDRRGGWGWSLGSHPALLRRGDSPPLHCPLSSCSLGIWDYKPSPVPRWAPFPLQPAWLSQARPQCCTWLSLNELSPKAHC